MDIILDILPYVVVAVAGYQIGAHVTLIKFMINLSKKPEEMIELLSTMKELKDTDPGAPEDAIEMTAEQVNGVYYMYATINGQFLGQGENFDKAIENVARRFPGKKFWCDLPEESTQSS